MSFSNFTTVCLLASFLIGLVHYQRIDDPPIRWLILYSGLALVPDIFYTFANDPSGKLTRIFYCLMLPLEYSIYVGIFYSLYSRSLLLKRLLIGSIIGIISYGLFKLTTKLDERTAVGDLFWVVSMASITLSLLYFSNILRSGHILNLKQEPLFWIATGLLFFYTGNLIATGFYHRLYSHSKSLAKNLYYLNYILNMLRYVLFSLSFVIAATNKAQADGR